MAALPLPGEALGGLTVLTLRPPCTKQLQAEGLDTPSTEGCGLICARGRLRREKWVLLPGSTTDCYFERQTSSL